MLEHKSFLYDTPLTFLAFRVLLSRATSLLSLPKYGLVTVMSDSFRSYSMAPLAFRNLPHADKRRTKNSYARDHMFLFPVPCRLRSLCPSPYSHCSHHLMIPGFPDRPTRPATIESYGMFCCVEALHLHTRCTAASRGYLWKRLYYTIPPFPCLTPIPTLFSLCSCPPFSQYRTQQV